MEHALQSQSRIEVADTLRGFIVMAIILLHNIEHFNLYNFLEATTDFTKVLGKGVQDTLFFLFFERAYAIFALLFGLSSLIQFDNQARRGKDSRLHFFWRLVFPFFIGCFNASFSPGEVLVFYSILGIVLISVCKSNNKVVLAIAVVLMLQPTEWGKFIYALMHPEHMTSKEQWLVHCMRVYSHMEDTSFWEMIKSNLWDGQLYSFFWAWDYGHFSRTSALFILGILLERKGLFADLEERRTSWTRTFAVEVVRFILLYYLSLSLPGLLERAEELRPMSTTMSSSRNFSSMCVLVPSFIFS